VSARDSVVVELVCEECRRVSVSGERGWQAYRADLDDDGHDELVFYCPVCAAREFAPDAAAEASGREW
jgi:hypothetical protein